MSTGKGADRKAIGRSENMRRIRSTDTNPEMLLRRSLHSRGVRYRLHSRTLPGKPDIVFASKRLVVFVHGCFWHQHPGCREASKPHTNRSYWEPKLRRNVERDVMHGCALRQLGYSVVILWECEIERDCEAAATTVVQALQRQL